MLEKDLIQARGFKNTVSEDGTVTGFQVRVRLVYYRGIWLSQIRPGSVFVDGEEYKPDQIKWKFGNKVYSVDELSQTGDIMWNLLEPATLFVVKPGGLSMGYHDVKVDYLFSSSYMPPVIDTLISETTTGDHKRKLLLVE
ncbi:DUF6379 domain-containing protein [Lactiplantibacillus xiangfangensis]|uniref:C-deglycosylation enzyme beta subunit n=1 Tax=Lactiplantibacillus xiangfangensis TaxID=942150 RepID=A0A0R2MCY7_9LACO|nr:DUF6379 domain-containing protein [Lactiplantibacillus xiangfangensis]KRO11573.1 hypothetical protein IV64_GL002402 [Lactiplantibacillus xiangfangensis]